MSPAFPNPQHEHPKSSEPVALPTPPEVRTLAIEHTIRWEPADHTAAWTAAPLAALSGIEPVVVHQRALAEIETLATAARRSAFGVLYGATYRCPRLRMDYLLIEGVQPGSSADIGPDADLRSALGAIIAQLSASGVRAVGWYRCGGQGGIRISPGDVAMHAALFPEAWSVALLRDSASTEATAAIIRLDGHRPHVIPFFELLSPESPADLNPKRTAIAWSSYHLMSDQAPPETPEEPIPLLDTSVPRHPVVQSPNASDRVRSPRVRPFEPRRATPAPVSSPRIAADLRPISTVDATSPGDTLPPEPPPPPAPSPDQSIERIFDEPASPPTNDPKRTASRRSSSRLFSFRPRFGARAMALAAIALAIFAAWYATHR